MTKQVLPRRDDGEPKTYKPGTAEAATQKTLGPTATGLPPNYSDTPEGARKRHTEGQG